MSAKIKTRAWDSAEHLRDEEDIRLYIEAAQEEAPDDAAFLASVLGTVARARNMSELARETGIARETLYKVTRGEGNPTLDTVGKLAKALGFKITLTPIAPKAKLKSKPVFSYLRKRTGKVASSTSVADSLPPKPPAPKAPARKRAATGKRAVNG